MKSLDWSCLLLITLAWTSLFGLNGFAADSPSKSKAKSKSNSAIKALDARVKKLEDNMLKEILEVSSQYEDAGQHARAKTLLEVLLKLNPEFPGLKEKLDQLNDKVFDAQEIEYILDVSRGWTPVKATAIKGKVVRVEVEGEYNFQLTAELTADGLASKDGATEFVEGIPCGALMAMIVKDGKPGKPVQLKAKMQWTPAEDGLVMLKINAPVGHKSTGKLAVKLSGLVSAD